MPTNWMIAEADRERRILELRERMHALGVEADDWDDEGIGRFLAAMEDYQQACLDLWPYLPPVKPPQPDPVVSIRFRYGFESGPVMYRLPSSATITGHA